MTRISRRSVLGRFLRNREGNVAMMFGLLLLPMIGAIGLAVDYGQVLTARNKAQVAADAAALQAAGVARDLIKVSDGSPAATQAALAEAKRRAEGIFKAHADRTGLQNWQLETILNRDGQNITARVNYTLTADTYIAGLFGHDTYEAGGGAGSSSSLPNYVDVYLALDVSQSMGLGATQEDMAKLFVRTSPNCVFGCHVPTDGQTITNQQVAKNNNIRLRIDVLRESVKKMIDTAHTDAGEAATYRFGLYTMGAMPSNLTMHHLNELSPLSGDYAALTAKADRIDLGPNDHRGVGDSYLKEDLEGLLARLPAVAGDGSAQSRARAYVFIITDGLRDAPNNGVSCPYGWLHCVGTIDPSVCTSMKSKNVTVGVLYTTYLPVYNTPGNPASGYRGEYRDLVINTGLAPLIAPRLEECASPGWFFEASDASSIDKAMTKMFEQTTNVPTLIF